MKDDDNATNATKHTENTHAIAGSFTRLLQASEKDAQRVYESVIRFSVYADKRRGKLKRKQFTVADAAEIAEEEGSFD